MVEDQEEDKDEENEDGDEDLPVGTYGPLAFLGSQSGPLRWAPRFSTFFPLGT